MNPSDRRQRPGDGGGWHPWLGSGVRRPRCEVCGTGWLVFRYTNGELSIWVCRRHRDVIPGRGEPAAP